MILSPLVFPVANIIYSFTKQANLMRRSTVLSLPLLLVFPGLIYVSFLTKFKEVERGRNTNKRILKKMQKNTLTWHLNKKRKRYFWENQNVCQKIGGLENEVR